MHTILPAIADNVQHETSPAFIASRDRFDRIVGWLEGRLEVESRELFRQMFQDHLDLRAQREPRLEAVVGADGVARRGVEADHERGLMTVFG